MQESESNDIHSQYLKLLKFNYENLHNSVWNAHKLAWNATQIFLSVLFAFQGVLIAYVYVKVEIKSFFSSFIGAIAAELLVFTWWRMTKMFEHYNDLRIKRLKKIEAVFNQVMNIEEFEAKFSLTPFVQYELPYNPKYSPMKIYDTFFWIYTILNLALLASYL
jgi:hypothetical protein